jgi:Rhodanese-related sulfurtransferase
MVDATGPLVSAETVAANLEQIQTTDADYRLIEVNIQQGTYESSHIPGAVSLDWQRDLRDTETFDVLSPAALSGLLGDCGVTRETTIILYGDFFNWFAAHAYWLLRYYRHENVVLLDGGRSYWVENGYPMTTEVPSVPSREYHAPEPDESIRARRGDVEAAVESGGCLLDARAPPEYRGDILAPPGWNEGVQRGGHIPGAVNTPCRDTIQTDRRFRSRTRSWRHCSMSTPPRSKSSSTVASASGRHSSGRLSQRYSATRTSPTITVRSSSGGTVSGSRSRTQPVPTFGDQLAY